MKYISILFALLIFSCGAKKQSEPVEKSIGQVFVKTQKLSMSSMENTIRGLGIVMNGEEAKPSFKTGGIISKLYFKEGSNVKKGQLLASLHLNEISAQVSQANEALQKAKRDATRVENLYKDSVATLEQYQNAKSALHFAQQQADIAAFNLRYSSILSPVTGKVAKIIMREGELAGPGMPICYLVGTETKQWKITTGLTDQEYSATNIGDSVQILLDAQVDKIYQGIVHSKSILTNGQSGTFDIEIIPLQTIPNLAVGMVAKVNIYAKNKKSALYIPVEAISESNGSEATLFVYENGKAMKKSIRIGKINGAQIEIISGLQDEAEIITTGSGFLEDGQAVIALP